MKNLEPKKVKSTPFFAKLIGVIISAVILAYGLEALVIPNGIMDGGVVGVAIIISRLIDVPMGVLIGLLSIPFLFLGYKQMGKTFVILSGTGIGVLSVATILLHNVPAIVDDVLLASVFGGMIIGLGVGMAIKFGGALDGTEIIAILVNQKKGISVGKTVISINVVIFSVAGVLFSVEEAMYSVITYFIAYMVIDLVTVGLNESKSVMIISEKSDEIAEAISKRLGRGGTFIRGNGIYSNKDFNIVYTVITRMEMSKLETIITEVDDKAFYVLAPVSDIRGGQFNKQNIH